MLSSDLPKKIISWPKFIERVHESAESTEYLLLGFAIIFSRMTPVSYFYGLGVISTGIAMMIWCAGHSRPGRIEGGDVSGPWRFVRHPDIVARFLIVFGTILLARSPFLFGLAVVVLGFQYRQMVKDGDVALERWLGPSFSIYRLFVPSFLPQFIPARLPQYSMRTQVQSSPWSLSKAWRRRSLVLILVFSLVTLFWFSLVLYWELNSLWLKGPGIILLLRSLWLAKVSWQPNNHLSKVPV